MYSTTSTTVGDIICGEQKGVDTSCYCVYWCAAGPLKPEITVKYIAVSTIFFNSGLSLKTEVCPMISTNIYKLCIMMV